MCMTALQRAGIVFAGMFLMICDISWSADMPPEGAAMPFTIGPGQQKTLAFLRLRDNTCEQVSNDFQLTRAPTLGTIVPVTRLGFQLGLAKCKYYNYNMMAYMAPATISYTTSDQFEYSQMRNSGPLTIGGYVTLCSRAPSSPNGPCP